MQKAKKESSEIRKEVQRTIRFFWGANEFVGGRMKLMDFSEVCKDINAMESMERYMQGSENELITTRVINAQETDRTILARVRRDELPPTERLGGTWGTLNLPDTDGIAGVIHIRFFEKNIMGIESNKDGPWPTKLRDYLQDRFASKYSAFYMAPVIDKDALERLNRIETVRCLEIVLSDHTLNRLSDAKPNNYFDVIKKVPALGDAGVIRIGWSPLKRNELLNAEEMKALVLSILEGKEYFDKKTHIRITGFDHEGARESFDLAQDRVVCTKGILKIGRERCVDSASAFRAIEEAYTQCKERFPRQEFAR